MKLSRILLVLLLLVSLARPTFAQPAIDKALHHPFPSAEARKVADWASWGTVAAGIALEIKADHSGRGLLMTGVRHGVVVGATSVLKGLTQRKRPCFPDCAPDNNYYSFPSGHTAHAYASMGGGTRWQVTLPLAVTTQGLRLEANKHWFTDTAGGALIGLLTSRIH